MRTLSLLAAAAASFIGVASAHAASAPGSFPATDGAVTLVAGGCGFYGHRDPWGRCVPNYRPIYRPAFHPCPPGFHLGPYRDRCWPN